MADEEYVYVLHARSTAHTGEDAVVIEGIGDADYTLLECETSPDATIAPGDRVSVGDDASTRIQQRLAYDDLSQVARDQLDHAVTALVEHNEDRFIDFFNTAGPLSLRRHQLDLLPGIGETRRNHILQERERQPFTGFGDLTARITGLPDPASIIAARIVTELTTDDHTYRVFVT